MMSERWTKHPHHILMPPHHRAPANRKLDGIAPNCAARPRGLSGQHEGRVVSGGATAAAMSTAL